MGDPLLTSVAVVVGVVVVVLLALFVLWRMMWRVAEPNEALVISGLHQGSPNGVGESLGFKIVTGKGTLVLPGVQMVRRLSLDLRETDLQVDCVSQQGIPLKIRAVVIYKVGDDYASIANAARRFLDQPFHARRKARIGFHLKNTSKGKSFLKFATSMSMAWFMPWPARVTTTIGLRETFSGN